MFLALNLMSTFLGTKTGKVVGIVMLILGVVAVIYTVKKASPQKTPVPIISLLSKVEYMQKLELVQYYSNHIMELGDPDELQKLSFETVDDTVEARAKMIAAQSDLRKAEIEFAESSSKLESIEELLDALQFEIDSLGMALTPFSKYPANPSPDRLVKEFSGLSDEEIRGEFGEDVAEKWEIYLKVSEKNYKNKKQKRKALKDPQRDLKDAYIAEKKRLANLQRDKESDLKQKRKDLKLDKVKKEAESLGDDLQKKEDEYKLAQDDLKTKAEIATQAKKALEEARKAKQSLGNTLNPKLLAIVSAVTASYIDLEKITYHMVNDSLVEITIDSVIVDKPLVIMDDALNYEIGGGPPQIKNTHGGIYYEIFQQVRLAVLRIEVEAIEKAKSNGMMLESRKGACDYFKGMTKSFGVKSVIKFKHPKCDCKDPEKILKETPTLEVEDADSVAVLDSLIMDSVDKLIHDKVTHPITNEGDEEEVPDLNPPG